MRISELARTTGIPIPTIKYYLREGLLPPGARDAPNQAVYGDRHVRRLRLVRVLLEVGGLSIERVRAVLRAIDDPAVPIHDMLGVAHAALALRRLPDEPDGDDAERDVDAFLASLGWRVARATAARRDLVAALVALRRLGWPAQADAFRPYATAVEELAAREVDVVVSGDDREALVERVVVGTVVFDVVGSALRRLAQEHHSAMMTATSAEPRGSQPTAGAPAHRASRPTHRPG